MIEIELKARLPVPEPVLTRLGTFAQALGAVDKQDNYWRFPPAIAALDAAVSGASARPRPPNVRVRRMAVESPVATVGFKRKERRAGLEINDEREFMVDGAAVFEELLETLGLEICLRKHKTGTAWRSGRVLIEVVEVADLGWFAELEILADNDREETIATARTELAAVLARLGLSENEIEHRYYSEMLSAEASGVPAGD